MFYALAFLEYVIGGGMNSKGLKKILIVDDEQSILLSLSYALRTDGVEVIACGQIELAEEALENSHFDLVITDIRMSGVAGIDGLELLSYVKNLYRTEVIVMTGYGTEEIESEAYARGALHYFEKPIDIPGLLKTVAAIGIPVKNI
jgi:DNA-binding NtrC family response regulator